MSALQLGMLRTIGHLHHLCTDTHRCYAHQDSWVSPRPSAVQTPGHSWENAFFWGKTRTRERFEFLTTAGNHKNDQIGRRERDREVCLRSKAEGRKLLVLIKEILHGELLHSLCGCSWDAKKTAFTDRENRVGRKQTHTHTYKTKKFRKLLREETAKGRWEWVGI